MLEQAEHVGWPESPRTARQHVYSHMRGDLAAATHPFLEYLGPATYRLNVGGKRAAQVFTR